MPLRYGVFSLKSSRIATDNIISGFCPSSTMPFSQGACAQLPTIGARAVNKTKSASAMAYQDLLEKLERKIDELSVFMDLSKTLTSSLNIKEVLKVMMSKVSELLGPKSWSLLLLDDEQNELVAEIVVGHCSKSRRNKRIRLGEGIEGWVAKEGRPLLINNRSDLVGLQIRAVGPLKQPISMMCVPLRSQGKALGVIEVTDQTGSRVFSEEDLSILGTLADYAAIAIENARNFQRVEELTIMDDLTSLYNARHLHQLLDFELVRSKRHKLEFSLIFLDLDFFKRVNDQYGHLMGSQLLKEVAQEIARSLRKLDVGTRYGGDEFVLLLPQTSKKEAYAVAERVRQRLEQAVFLRSAGLNVRMTASFGVACYPVDASHKEDIVRLADQAMYRVKAGTRNDVAMAGS